MNDLKFAFRQLLKNPGFTLVAVLTLALGIGANTAIFSIVYGVLLRALPYAEPERIVRVTSWREGNRSTTSPPDYLDWRAMSHAFRYLAAFHEQTWNLTGVAEPERLDGAVVGGDFFRLMGV